MMNRSYDLRQYAAVSNINTLNMLFDKYPYVLIVEGTTDKRTYSVLFQHLELYVHSADGKKQVRQMLATLLPANQSKCRAIVDRDYDFFTGHKSGSAQVVYTDAHSLETQLWMTDNGSAMLPKIVNELIDYNTIHSAKLKMSSIYTRAYDTAYRIGILRLADMQERWNIKFQDYSLTDSMFDPQTDELNIHSFLESLSDLDANEDMVDEVIDFFDELMAKRYNRWEIMQGHDISAAFIYFVKKECTFYPPDWSGWDEPQMAITDFESRTRQACNLDNLKNSPFYSSIVEWTLAN